MGAKVRVLQLGSPAGIYGAERWILALIRNLNHTRVETHVASIKDAPDLEASLCLEAKKQGFPVRIIEGYGRFNYSVVRKLRNYILERKFDFIHTHGYKTDLIGLLAVRGTSCRVMTTPHGWTKNPDVKLRIYEWMDRAIFPLMDAVVPLSEKLYRDLHLIPGLRRRLHFIQNGVDISEIESGHDIAPELTPFREKGEFIIGYIGRLIPGKALEILLRAVALSNEPRWRVVIVGEGEMEQELIGLSRKLGIDRQVCFYGFREDRLAFLRGFDVFVLPSRSEGIPRCLMEAMGVGIPVVASDIPGCRVLVDGKTTGLLFETDKPDLLSRSIRRIGADSALRRVLVESAGRNVRKNFSAERMAEQYENLYFSLKGNKNKAAPASAA